MTGDGGRHTITDLHTHLIPGVDDGAQDLDEALLALGTLIDEGVDRVVATPHFKASLLERPAREADLLFRFDDGYARLVEAAASAGLPIAIERGCEFKLDCPAVDLSDARLRLAGSRYALVEFASFRLPPYAGNQLLAVRDAGWIPILAHPERYAGVTEAWPRVERWVEGGTLLQVNTRSLLGLYGREPQEAARELLRVGWVCCLASDYHARGAPDFETVLRLLAEGVLAADRASTAGSEGGVDPGGRPTADPEVGSATEAGAACRSAVECLVRGNPERIIADEPPRLVPGLDIPSYDRRSRQFRWLR